ncbi:ergothioneine biosynthesis glutamate--cysteine ligase EgtA [Nocardioides psychrotolerans]|uniref:ergothioneine biosynthesis glutamate--cysteine ligase EgtA n=1 Tax=Nocardioides psychrotolerans TaxID=1005945 RepID=UPI0031377101
MTAETVTALTDVGDVLDTADPMAAATAYVAAGALSPGTDRRVGLELELHLVDLATPARRPSWVEVQALVADLPPMPSGSTVTLEPGAQVELSTPPRDDVSAAVAALRADREVLRRALGEAGFGAAPLGADPAREVSRCNPAPRYAAMEQHFEARGCGAPARAMMSATAALQVNLDAGPPAGWSARIELIRSLVPMFVAASATSPYLGGRASGWHSMRQETWHGIDHGRSDPIPMGEPTVAWALYALNAPVMLLRGDTGMTPVRTLVSFGDWLREPARLGRRATQADLDYHLTTLFPPVRPRGYVEIRCIDALPDRWWPALAGLATTLIDDAVAADVAADLCQPVAHAWEAAARHGLADPALRRAVTGCAEVAARRGPVDLRPQLEALAELVASGRTPADEIRSAAESHGPLHVLEEEAHA